MEKPTGSGKQSDSLAKRGEQTSQKPVYFKDLPTEEQLHFLHTMLGGEKDRKRSIFEEWPYGGTLPYFFFQMFISAAVLYVYAYLTPSQDTQRFSLIFQPVFVLLSIAFTLDTVADFIEFGARRRQHHEVLKRIAKLEGLPEDEPGIMKRTTR